MPSTGSHSSSSSSPGAALVASSSFVLLVSSGESASPPSSGRRGPLDAVVRPDDDDGIAARRELFAAGCRSSRDSSTASAPHTISIDAARLAANGSQRGGRWPRRPSSTGCRGLEPPAGELALPLAQALLDHAHFDLRQPVGELGFQRGGDEARGLAELLDEQPRRHVAVDERGDAVALRAVQFAQGVRGQQGLVDFRRVHVSFLAIGAAAVHPSRRHFRSALATPAVAAAS